MQGTGERTAISQVNPRGHRDQTNTFNLFPAAYLVVAWASDPRRLLISAQLFSKLMLLLHPRSLSASKCQNHRGSGSYTESPRGFRDVQYVKPGSKQKPAKATQFNSANIAQPFLDPTSLGVSSTASFVRKASLDWAQDSDASN
ncbi:hypothetical protein Cob_v006622 [Colletotrichum orbiculare MAFF 240422]|uniref:Uncharacterized protein n=1 Tax=Colletotrichum orbiculare (strain 104-T / ATCC 96160 / CBS 514.97 / LARS 414 / MAFF 240422) TaxID=1213857 RepID=A0A484FSM2_COLOR|nr:hypothetical protein Cob_v006622 [Colletotrichum orbiculare MAFF 240422]